MTLYCGLTCLLFSASSLKKAHPADCAQMRDRGYFGKADASGREEKGQGEERGACGGGWAEEDKSLPFCPSRPAGADHFSPSSGKMQLLEAKGMNLFSVTYQL